MAPAPSHGYQKQARRQGVWRQVSADAASQARTAEVMSPEGTNLVLATNVPDVELDILVGDSLDVEADSRNGRDILSELELVENSGLASGVETEHEEAHFLGSEEPAHNLGELATHGYGLVRKG